MINEKVLVINPGSTSTKVAVFDGEDLKWTESINHSAEELKKYKRYMISWNLDCNLQGSVSKITEKIFVNLLRLHQEEVICLL